MMGRLFILLAALVFGAAAAGDMPVRITLKTEGGLAHFPGLQQPVQVAVPALPNEAQSQLHNLIEACDFFNLPERPARPAPGAADYRTHVITVETAHKTHTVTVYEPVKDEHLRQLIQLVREMRASR